MFFRILFKDLKRKKTMNIILLIFVLLSAMFASSSVNNMISVFGGIDYFFEKAKMPDYVMLTLNANGQNPTDEIVQESDAITQCSKEDIIFFSAKNLFKDGKKYVDFENPGLITSVSDAKLDYFNKNNEVISEVDEGHIYLGGILADPDKTTIGDNITLEIEGVTLELTIDGYLKDALLGSPFMGNPRMLMNDNDVKKILTDEAVTYSSKGAVYYIDTNDLKALTDLLTDVPNAIFAQTSKTIKLTYMLDMITAGILLIVSVCLILVAFTMLSFTIKFTLSEDFREIGVMKAVGLRNSSIRNMYMIKYLCIAIVGAVLGYVGSIPFGEILLRSVSEKMVLGNDSQIFVGIVSSAAVVVIILLFCYSCTRSIRTLSPIDAVRNGETGERYNRKSVLKLHKSKLSSNFFLAINDVISKPKQYASMIITFTICLLLIQMLATTANTLMSDKLLFLLGTTKSDVYYSSTDKVMETMRSSDEETLPRLIKDIEDTLAENDMPGKVHIELQYQLPVEYKDTKLKVVMQRCSSTKATDYTYDKGLAPVYDNEVAFTPQVLEKLGAEIGDKVFIEIDGVKKEYIITATFVSFNQLGETGRLNENVKIKNGSVSSAFAFQIDFDDHPGAEVIDQRIEKLKKIYKTDEIFNSTEFVDVSINSASSMKLARNMVLIIALLIAGLITVLMERSFISKETSEIALMKAIGFKNRSISSQHTLRFVVVILISTVIAGILVYPFTKLVCDKIFAVMGALSGIVYEIRPVELFAIYPAILASVIIFAAFVTSLYMKTVRTDAMGNIE